MGATRRRLLGALALAGLGGAATQRSLLEVAAPFSGRAWGHLGDSDPIAVTNPYGAASITYDEYGVPHVEADDEAALYFAAGYVQARDRLFQMDLTRRNMAGELAEAVGESQVESDRFHRRMDFKTAAAASWEALTGTAVEDPVRAFSDGVNHRIDVADSLPLEFRLLDYEPKPWNPTATMLLSKQIAWSLTGTFWDLERATILDRLGEKALELYPETYDHDVPIIRPEIHGDWDETEPTGNPDLDDPAADLRGLSEWLRTVGGGLEEPIGSNSWIVSGEHTASGQPMLANDPHLSLQVPPVWYEQRLVQDDMDVRGVAFPGVPFVVIGQNEHVAWGFTNVGGDVIDAYTYEMRDGGREYRLGDDWRSVESRTETIPVADAPDREVTVRKTAHGPLLEREGRSVAVSWVGLTATREPLAIYRYNRATDLDDFREGLRVFDIPGQNTVVIDDSGGTLYYPAARYPIRRIDGEVVAGNRLFDGSEREGEWAGFTPYGRSTWEGFVPFEAIPHLDDPGYVATANQRVTYDTDHYFGDAEYMGDPYRARRIYDRLDGAVDEGDVDVAFMQDLQRDLQSSHADEFVPQILEARDAMSDDAAALADELADWDHEMRADSRATLIYALCARRYPDAVLGDEFGQADLDSSYYPGEDWPLQQLSPDSDWFDDDRADAIAAAMEAAASDLETHGYEVYGDLHRLAIEHPFDVDFLNYPARPADGDSNTVFNVHDDGAAGSSWRMICRFDGPSLSILPGGNSGDYFSPHYDDQLDRWLAGEYKEMAMETPAGVSIRFEEGST